MWLLGLESLIFFQTSTAEQLPGGEGRNGKAGDRSVKIQNTVVTKEWPAGLGVYVTASKKTL